MTTSAQILEQLNRLLADAHGECFFYIGRCPAQFQRPCFLIEFISEEQQPATRVSVKKTSQFAVTYYGTLDDYAASDTEELLAVQDQMQSLFASGYLRLKDRALPVQLGKGERGEDWVKLDLTFDYFDDRPLPKDGGDPAEKMQEIHTNMSF